MESRPSYGLLAHFRSDKGHGSNIPTYLEVGRVRSTPHVRSLAWKALSQSFSELVKGCVSFVDLTSSKRQAMTLWARNSWIARSPERAELVVMRKCDQGGR